MGFAGTYRTCSKRGLPPGWSRVARFHLALGQPMKAYVRQEEKAGHHEMLRLDLSAPCFGSISEVANEAKRGTTASILHAGMLYPPAGALSDLKINRNEAVW